jgi:putative colanic acid biosynthesis UDP-glucose lipid carrier transferase
VSLLVDEARARAEVARPSSAAVSHWQAVAPAPPPQVGRSVAKRMFDLVAALALLVLLAPLMIGIAIAIRLTSPGPALFRQKRTGRNGRVFQILKFRSMRVMEDGPLQAARRDDARVTPVGSLLRRTSLDELPQLLNVVRGEMSLVGPRPHALAHDELFASIAPDYDERFGARPGLTGLAQISGYRGEVRTTECLLARLEADLRYIRGWSLWLDLKILAITAAIVWRDQKAY